MSDDDRSHRILQLYWKGAIECHPIHPRGDVQCSYCHDIDEEKFWLFGKIMTRNGHVQVYAWCAYCGTRAPGALSNSYFNLNDLPVVGDNRCDKCLSLGCELCSSRCERCDSFYEVEIHHWAPRALFDDYDKWPTARLCRPCHMKWHRIVTPGLVNERRKKPA